MTAVLSEREKAIYKAGVREGIKLAREAKELAKGIVKQHMARGKSGEAHAVRQHQRKTRSGKTIPDPTIYKEKRLDYRENADREFPGWTAEDHRDAYEHHSKRANEEMYPSQPGSGVNLRYHHTIASEAHAHAYKRMTGKFPFGESSGK